MACLRVDRRSDQRPGEVVVQVGSAVVGGTGRGGDVRCAVRSRGHEHGMVQGKVSNVTQRR